MSAMYDVIIVGSGIVGAATALGLARQTSLKIAVIEAKLPSGSSDVTSYDHRVSAISLASKHILQNLQSWDSIKAKRISTYTRMHVWDAKGSGEIDFDSQFLGEAALGYIIEDRVIRQSLHEQFSLYPNIEFLCPLKLAGLHEKTDHIELVTEDKKILTTKLLIAADGADSWVRTQAQIELTNKDYEHTAIVASVTTTLPHQATARQRFLSTGPLAFLPFQDPYHCSIVWSATHDYAKQLLALDDDAFSERLAKEFAHQLGDVVNVSKRHSFPLRMRHVKNYVRSRMALVGDAAHTVHPLAGQGVNLGLLDAAALVDVIVDAQNKQRDFSSLATLRKYERWRKGDVVAMLCMVSGLKQLFGSEREVLQTLRTKGLAWVNEMTWVKNLFANYAVGKREGLPRMAKVCEA